MEFTAINNRHFSSIYSDYHTHRRTLEITEGACENCGKSWEEQNRLYQRHHSLITKYNYQIYFCIECLTRVLSA